MPFWELIPGEKTSSTKSSGLITKLNDDLTKGEFVDVLKDMADCGLLSSFLKAQQMRLRTEGLQRQFLRMDACEFQTSMNIELDDHSDWETRLTGLLEVTQDYELVAPLWAYTHKRLFSEHQISPPSWFSDWVATCMSISDMTKEELKVWKLTTSRLTKDSPQPNATSEQDKDAAEAITPEPRPRLTL